MNSLNHFLFAFTLTLYFIRLDLRSVALALISSIVFGVLIDLDHYVGKERPWYHRRTWIQEPLGVVFIGLPLALALAYILKGVVYASIILVPYISHVILDYLCIFEANPLAPFTNSIKKREGKGFFYPDKPIKSENEVKWQLRVKERGYKAVSENYFTITVIPSLVFTLLVIKHILPI